MCAEPLISGEDGGVEKSRPTVEIKEFTEAKELGLQ